MKTVKPLSILSLYLISFAIAAAEDTATVIKLLGKVTATLKDGKVFEVKLDQTLPEGTKLETAEKSFVKLLFIDKSQMNLGPKSAIEIASFPKNQAGVINLVEGQIRSKVTKDYMQMDDKSKSKLFIKTKSAAMGIRGTDFQVNYNPQNENTSLITFEGAVAMGGIDRAVRDDVLNRETLEKLVSDEKAVMVKEGQFSAVTQIAERPMIPSLLAPTQLESLKNNETGINENKEGIKENSDQTKKDFKSPIPPGVDATKFSNSNSEMDKQLEKASDGKDIVGKISKEVEKGSLKENGPAEGFFNASTGAFKFPAGSVVDLATVNVIPPPQNAQFDPNTKTFILPPNFGKVDPTTGSYKAPEGLQLTSEGKFVAVQKSDNTGATNSGTAAATPGRGPASEANKPGAPGLNPPPSLIPTFLPPSMGGYFDPSRNPAGTPGQLPPNFDPQKLQDLANTKLQDITNSINQNNETNTSNPNSKVRFIFTAP